MGMQQDPPAQLQPTFTNHQGGDRSLAGAEVGGCGFIQSRASGHR